MGWGGVKHEGGYVADSIFCLFKIEDGFIQVVTRVYKLNDDVGKAEIGDSPLWVVVGIDMLYLMHWRWGGHFIALRFSSVRHGCLKCC